MYQQNADPAQVAHMMAIMGPLIVGFGLLFAVLLVIPYWQIFKKAGFPAPLALLMFLPLVNFIILYVVAFSRWKVVPAPDYAAVPPGAYPPAAYPPAAYPGQAGYTQQVAYPPAPGQVPQGYVPPNPPPPAI